MKFRHSILALCLLPQLAFTSQTIEFSSGKQKNTLIELYTSQGCSSCPPADKWLSRFKSDKRLWKDIIPVAFHVDYWDYLGWKDPYAQANNSARQQNYRTEGGVRSVYTPGFVINGKEWRGWFRRQAVKPDNTQEAGILNVSLNNQQVTAHYSDAEETLEFHVGLLGIGLHTPVLRGENSNKTLTEDFILLAHDTVLSRNGRISIPLPVANNASAERFALVVWVNQKGRQAPLQATGGWLPKTAFNR